MDMRDAYAASSSLNDLAARLGCHYSVAKRKALEAGFAVPAAHWGRQDTGATLDATLAETKLRRKAKEAEAVSREAAQRLLSQEELLAGIVAAASDPVAAPEFTRPAPSDGHKPHRSVIVHISDWQMGQKVSLVDTGGNVYDWDIMLGRMSRFFDGVVGSIHNQQRAYCIDDITLAYDGDMLEGHKVYKEQAFQLCKDAGAQAVEGAAAWASWEAGLRAAITGVPIRRRVVFGNHGIPEGRAAGAVPQTLSYEYIWHELLVANTQTLGIDDEFATHGRILYDSAGQRICMTHGDEVRGQMGIPFYGIRTAWMKHTQELGEVFRYFLFGHIHQTSLVTYGDGAALSNGDAVGYNNLTGKLRNPSSTPQQSVYFLSHERGLDEISYIHLRGEK